MTEIRSVHQLPEADRDAIAHGIMGYLPSPAVRDRIIEEAIKFKWTDCERFGTDVYQKLDPDQQVIVAGFEQFFAEVDTDGKGPRVKSI